MNFFGHFAPKKAARRSLIKKVLAAMYRGGATITSVDDEVLGLMLRAGLGRRIFERPAYDKMKRASDAERAKHGLPSERDWAHFE